MRAIIANAVDAALVYQTDHSAARRLYFELVNKSKDHRVRGNAIVTP